MIDNNRATLPVTPPELPSWLFIGLPVLTLLLPYFLKAFYPEGAEFYFAKESGAVENLTVLFLFVATLITFRTLSLATQISEQQAPKRFLTLWLFLYSLGCIYFLGEEISWGQHLFGWSTPDSWVSVNDQQETNLHNTSPLFDQIPRALMTAGIIIGGFAIPLYLHIKERQLNPAEIYYWAIPGFCSIPAASTVFFIGIHDKLYDAFGVEMPAVLDIKDGEVKEGLIALFILIYIASLKKRLERNS